MDGDGAVQKQIDAGVNYTVSLARVRMLRLNIVS